MTTTQTWQPALAAPPVPTGKRILFANVDADGHFNPLTPIALALKQHGYEVRWYTSRKYATQLAHLLIPFYPYQQAPEIDAGTVEEHFPGRKNRKTKIGKLSYDLEHFFIARAPHFYEDIRAIHRAYPFDLLIADITFSAIPLVKHLLGIPVFAVGVIPLMQTSRNLAPYGLGLPPARNVLQRGCYALLRGISKRVLFRRPQRLFKQLVVQYGLPVSPGGMFDTIIDASTLVLQSGTPGFEYPRADLAGNIRFVGPLMPHAAPGPTADIPVTAKLAQHRKVILLTQGTVEKDVEKLIVPALEAFKETEYLLVVTTGGSRTHELREKYPYANIHIEDYIPFEEVMPYASVFLTNGGYGGVLQAIAHGLPLVVAGVHEGKNEINARIGYFGLGINLGTEQPTPRQLRQSVAAVLADPLCKLKVRALQGEFRRYASRALPVRFVGEVLASGVIRPATP